MLLLDLALLLMKVRKLTKNYFKICLGVRLQRTCVLSKAHIKANTWIADSIIGWQSVVGKWVIYLKKN